MELVIRVVLTEQTHGVRPQPGGFRDPGIEFLERSPRHARLASPNIASSSPLRKSRGEAQRALAMQGGRRRDGGGGLPGR
jgi:hypothetical protein